LATALPPARSISATISSAGALSPPPSPPPPTPGSLTTTRAPYAAISFATSAPTPRPDPVQIATRPSSMPMSPPPRFF